MPSLRRNTLCVNTPLLVWLIPNKWNRRSAVQWYFPFPNKLFLKGQPRPLFNLFRLFKHALQFLQQINVKNGQWLWLSWWRSHFQLQRSAVWIQSSQKFILNIFCQLYWKDENKEKEAGIGQFFFKKMWKNVHPVYCAWIQTHDLWNTSLLP